MTYALKFPTPAWGCGQFVNVDGCTDLKVRIVSAQLLSDRVSYECAWFNNGAHQTAWFDEWRLS